MRKRIPNIITLLRFFIAILFVVLYVNDDIVVATVSFFIAAATDILDGWLARKMNVVSTWGALYDPLADKVVLDRTWQCHVVLVLIVDVVFLMCSCF